MVNFLSSGLSRFFFFFFLILLSVLVWRSVYLNNTIAFSHDSGFYDKSFNLLLQSNLKSYSIYYTLDGSVPTIRSHVYRGPILIDGSNSNNNSLIPTTPLNHMENLKQFIWLPPKEIKKSTIIRFALFKNFICISPVYSKTYFVNADYQFPVVSLITDSLNLFDFNKGIYVPGLRHKEEGFNYFAVGNYHNRGRDWEKDIHISYFNSSHNLCFETDAGMRMRGYSSSSFPQKSLNIYFRNQYGLDTINYDLFENNNNTIYKRLIFRNSGSDFFKTHFRDALLQELLSPMNLEIQRFSPSILFINGEYWGIHNIREKYDKYYFKYNYNIHEDSINIIKVCGIEAEEGDLDNYIELEDFIKENDVSIIENYNFLKSKIDIDNFIDFLIAEIYYAHYDWPCNNYKMWKTNHADAKWRFLLYDLDESFGYSAERSSYNTLSMEHATSLLNEWPYCSCSNFFFRSMLKNDEFKKAFLRKFKFHLENTFDKDRVLNKIKEYEKMFEVEMNDHIIRWNYPESVKLWYEEINTLKTFAIERPCVMKENIINYFQLDTFDFDCE